ncbi:MAG: nucleotidyl transferase AbiEii/AbiGii toxin family protein [Cyclobacteriaceae bacterium]|nr:nucleotidyl transferase AbiEii/AbiGii toxin family protein [Cyclobacteriaceae bacterium]
MLYQKAVEPNTLSLLKKLQQIPELYSFYLVGGTALALKFGHRISIDIDLFGEKFN